MSITVERRSRIRRKPIFEASRGELTGSGANATEAKADLNAKIDAALTGSYSPRIISYRGLTAVVFRNLHGWTYTVIRDDKMGDGIAPLIGIQGGSDDRDAVIQDAAYHVISESGSPDEIWDDSDVPAFLDDKGKRDTIITIFRFRRAHRWARDNGIDGDIHRWACEHEHDPRFVNRPSV